MGCIRCVHSCIFYAKNSYSEPHELFKGALVLSIRMPIAQIPSRTALLRIQTKESWTENLYLTTIIIPLGWKIGSFILWCLLSN